MANDLVPFEGEDNLPAAGAMDVAKSRGAQEVQAMVIMAKKFPRNQVVAEKRILDACKRKGLAETSQYSFPRGGQAVEGPSIRLAEVLAQNWGNLDYGVMELDRVDGVSTMMAYCWDLETNTRKTQVFTVAHVRDTKRGRQKLSDERDVYEMTANQGSRRVRSCILAIIPGDIVDAAVAECDRTISGSAGGKSMKERISEMAKMFEKFNVTSELIEKKLGHPLTVERTTETEMLQMKKIYLAIQDNMAKAEDYFDVPKPAAAIEPNSLKARAQAAATNTTQPVEKPGASEAATVGAELGNGSSDAPTGLGAFFTDPAPTLKGPTT